jgi:hypothetical protein
MIPASLALMSIALVARGVVADESDGRQAPAAATFDQLAFYDRLHQTFQLLCGLAHQAYFDHFRDEPDKLAVVYYYAGRLAESQDDRTKAVEHFSRSFELSDKDSYYSFYSSVRLQELHEGTAATHATYTKLYSAFWGAGPQALMRSALGEVARTDTPDATDIAQYFVNQLGFQPHIVLQRGTPVPSPELPPEQWPHSPVLARCALYDPELLWVHRRLDERKSSGTVGKETVVGAEQLTAAQLAVRRLREQPENRELSLRKFLDRHRAAVWELGWLHRCRALDFERAGELAAAREGYLRAWAIGESLFSVADRGRMDRFSPVFLAELGDVYARLGRYDLMLRYMYSDQGLPARYEIAKPIAELARVAESLRLAGSDDTSAVDGDVVLPETVSQILFGQPVIDPPATSEPTLARAADRTNTWGWVVLGGGLGVLLVSVVWRLSAAWRRTTEIRRV